MSDRVTWKINRGVHERAIKLQPDGVNRSYFIKLLLDNYEQTTNGEEP